MKKNYLIVMLALVCNFAMAQVQQTSYRGAFAPAPATMWTAGWTNFDPQNAAYNAVSVDPGIVDRYVIRTDITSNTTLDKTKVYELRGLITVRNNAVLTIPAGTVIRSAQTASALLITRGAKLIANGTAAEPIVFTSNNAVGSRNRGDWGGIVMLGRARYNINGGVNFIEGLTQTPITEFGGGTNPDDNDNSGILRFVRIEYAGFVFSPNNELNGLTMGAVGKGTVIENVQVSYSNDDSFEWFGGSVNCKNLVAFAGLDDDFDVDNGFTGIVQFGLAVKDPLAADISTSEIFEVDNNSAPSDTDTVANPWADFTSGIFTNITAIGANLRPNGVGTFETPNSLHDRALRLRRNSRLNIYNSIFLDSRRGLHIETLSSNGAYVNDLARFKNNTIAGQSLANAFAATNTTTISNPTTAAVTTWFNSPANANTLNTSSAGILANPYNGTAAADYRLVGEGSGAIDYRPSSTTGADFTDSKLSGLVVASGAPGVTPVLQYCKGVVAPALVVNFTATGVSLRWYTKPVTFKILTQNGGKDLITLNPDGSGNQIITPVDAADILTPVTTDTFKTTAPVILTSTVGTKYYFVSEVDANGAESGRAQVAVTTIASPTVALGSITSTVGGVAATAAVGNYINTATEVTYTVPASTDPTVTNYLWTVPAGVTIVSQGAGLLGNSIVVNYQNVPAGILKVGNISVQARNAALCGGALKTLAVTAVLPAAPGTLVLNDAALPLKLNTITNISAPVALTSFAKYMGTTTPLTVVAKPVVGAQSYVWELPTGVNIPTQTTVESDVTRFYNLFPFQAISALTTAPTGAGNVFYEIRTITYTDGTSVATGRLRQNARAAVGIFGTLGYIPAIVARNVELTNLTNEGVTINPAYPITSSTSNVINVNFAGVNTGNTFNFLTTAATPVATSRIRIGVKTRNGVGVSKTANATATNPVTSSEAKLLTLSAVRPAAPTKIVMTNDAVSTTTAVLAISKFVGTSTTFRVNASASVLASSYSWELPAGVNLVSPVASLITNEILVNFANVAPATTAIAIGVKGVNGIGSSVTVNTAPNAASTAKLLKLTAAIPAAVSAVTGQFVGVCGGSSYNYTITPSLLANSYVVTAPAGSIVTSANNLTNNTNVLSTTDLSFTVVYPAGFVATTTAPQTLAVAAANGVGTSANKSYTLSTLMPALGIATPTSYTRAIPVQITISPLAGAVSYNWTALPAGATLVNGQGTNSILVDFSGVLVSLSSVKVSVAATNACGVTTATKAITLSNAAPGAKVSSITKGALTVSTTEVYPNPVSGDYNIDVTASKAGALEISVYSLDGTLIVNPKSVQLQEGANTITENISDLNSGIYILQLVNSSNNEVITKKLIKN